MTSVSAVPVVDTSASMTYSKYVAQTVIDTKAFLRYMRPGDKVAVVAYDTWGRNVYPSASNLATVDQSLNVTADAARAVGTLSFQGASTAIGRGLQQARTFLDSAAAPKACVLLTDGYQNDGPSPLDVLPPYPVMTCAMGPESDQSLLQQIASRTGGQYFYAPRAADMMRVYNQVRSNTASAVLLANQLADIATNDYLLIPATVSQTPGGTQMSAVWSNGEVTYTRGSPSGNQLSVTLVEPSGATSPLDPTIIGDGFVIYNVPNPAPGNWYVQLEFAGSGQGINCTGGGFQFASAGGAAMPRLVLEAPEAIVAGQPLGLKARVTENGEPLAGVRGHAVVTSPSISLSKALEKHDDLLGSVEPDASDLARGMPEPLARLAALRAKLLPDTDILAHRNSAVHLQGSGAEMAATVPGTTHAGSYTVQVTVTGESPVTGPFQRTELVSVLVAEPAAA